MRRRAHHHYLVLICGLASCGPLDLDLHEHRSAITDGQTHTGHPSVGMLSIGNSMCTATLVGQKTVLTAAHCIKPGYQHTFLVGGQSVPAVSAHQHPSYKGEGGSYDIAIVRLSSAPQGVTPAAIATTAPTVGNEITLVGFGVTACQLVGPGQISCTKDSGVKRIAKNKIASRSTVEFTFVGTGGGMGSTCKGDSGGPAFATLNAQEVVVGVTSRGDMPCGKLAIDTRVDTFATWIEQTAGGDVQKGGDKPPPPQDTEPPKVTIKSPVAGATVNPSVTVVSSVTDDTGVSKAELLVDDAVVASLTKAPFDFTVSLADGTHLLKVVGHDVAGNRGEASVSVTVGSTPLPGPDPDPIPGPDPGSFGAGCADNQDCQSGICADDADGIGRYCTQVCAIEQQACPDGASCLPTNLPSTYVCGPPLDISTAPNMSPDGQLLGGCSLSMGEGRSGWGVVFVMMMVVLWRLRRWRVS